MCEKKICKVERKCRFRDYRLVVGSKKKPARETEVEICKSGNIKHNGQLVGLKWHDIFSSHQAMGLRFHIVKV